MSDTTPRPDEMPSDPTAPPQPADVEVTEIVPAAADSAATPAEPQDGQPAPAYEQPQYAQQQYAQQPPPPPPPAYAAPAPGTAVAGPNPMSPSEERTWGTIAHAGTLGATVLSGGTLGFVCALVIYLIQKDRGPFVRHHSANALNVQIFAALLVIGGIILTVTVIGAIIGIPMMVFAALYALIVHIVGAVKANNGEWWNPPMTPQFVK